MIRTLSISTVLITTSLIVFSLTAGAVQAQDNSQSPDQLLSEVRMLDSAGTCTTDSQQKMAVQTLKWFKTFKQEDLNGQMALFADDFKLYHSALVRFVVLNPSYAPFLRWGIEPVTITNYRGTLAQLISGEDQSQPGDEPQKLTCGHQNNVIVNVNFRGFKTSRDPKTGCITHRASYSGPTTKTFVFDPTTLKMKINYVDFDGNLADMARAQLGAMAKDPVLAEDKATCRTAAETDAQYGVIAAPAK